MRRRGLCLVRAGEGWEGGTKGGGGRHNVVLVQTPPGAAIPPEPHPAPTPSQDNQVILSGLVSSSRARPPPSTGHRWPPLSRRDTAALPPFLLSYPLSGVPHRRRCPSPAPPPRPGPEATPHREPTIPVGHPLPSVSRQGWFTGKWAGHPVSWGECRQKSVCRCGRWRVEGGEGGLCTVESLY